MAANIFDGSTDSNWGTAANWSLNVVPTAGDGHVATFDATSPNCTVNASARACNAIDFTGYTNTITMSQSIAVSGNITLAASMGVAGAAALATAAPSTLTSNGKTWPNSFNPTNATHTLADNWTVGTLTPLNSATVTLNGFKISVTGSLVCSTNTITAGTTVIEMTGTGTITLPTAGNFGNSLTINTAGTITFAAANGNYRTGTLTYTAGTVVTTGSTLTCALATTFACAGISWNNVTLIGSTTTYTFAEDLNVTGLLSIGATTAQHTLNGSAINASGGFRFLGSAGNVVGTTVLNITGTGTLDAPNATASTGRVDNPITINAPGGTVTVDPGFRARLDQLLLTAGTVITDAGTWAAIGGGGGGGLLAHPGMRGGFA